MSSSDKKEKETRPKEFTDIIGGHGPWQLGIFTFCFFCSVPHCFHNLIMTFFAPNIEHWCARPAEMISANISTDQWKNFSLPMIPKRGGGLERSSCTFYNDSMVNGTMMMPLFPMGKTPISSCESWEYDESFYKSTMVDEWNLVCDREWLVSVAKTVYMVGFLVSVTICGQLSDRFGRRPTVITCLGIFLIAANLTLFSTNFLMFIVLRFFVALGITTVFTISYVILMEVIGAEYRTLYCFTFKLGWVFAYMLLPFIAWLIPSWFWLQFTITIPWLSLLCVFWVIPETPRWLLTHSKYNEAEAILLKAAEKNRKDMKMAKDEISHFIRQASKIENNRNETVFDLLRTPALRRNTISMYFCWFIISYIYYALSWNTNDLGGDPYWTFFICGAVELPATIIFLYVSKAIGHRNALLITNVAAGLCLLAMIPVPDEMAWLSITFSMTGKFFNSASFDIVYIYSAEIFPTVVRNVGVGSSSTWARIGALVAPFIKQVADVTHPVVPLVVPGIMSILSGFLLLFLPETKNRKIPDTLEEGEMFARKWKSYKVTDSYVSSNGIKMEER